MGFTSGCETPEGNTAMMNLGTLGMLNKDPTTQKWGTLYYSMGKAGHDLDVARAGRSEVNFNFGNSETGSQEKANIPENVIYDGHGNYQPAPGYGWVNPGKNDLRVRNIEKDIEHEKDVRQTVNELEKLLREKEQEMARERANPKFLLCNYREGDNYVGLGKMRFSKNEEITLCAIVPNKKGSVLSYKIKGENNIEYEDSIALTSEQESLGFKFPESKAGKYRIEWYVDGSHEPLGTNDLIITD